MVAYNYFYFHALWVKMAVELVFYSLQLLPDHSSMELDLEEELMFPSRQVENVDDSPFCSAPMTISVDSAIHSGTGSRSASSSPMPLGMGHSFLRYVF